MQYPQQKPYQNPYAQQQEQFMPSDSFGVGDMNSMIPNMANVEAEITNIVGQIDPQTIIDNLDHALAGEQWNKEQGQWIMNASKRPLANDACRGAIVSYLDGILNNNTTMGWVDEKKLSHIMESIIQSIKRMFVVNLEEFGFVPQGESFNEGVYYNRGTPDSARMTLVANMIFQVCYLVLSRALNGMESRRIFKSLSMNDTMGYGMSGGHEGGKKKGWLGKLFG